MKPLILIKHSLPEVVENVPAREWKLSAEGRVRAWKLAEKLIEYQPEVIISSLEPKAQETAHIMADHFGLDCQEFEDLHEHDRSKSPYSSRDEFQALVQKFFERPDELVFGSETATEALQRFEKAVYSIMNLYEGKTVFVVAHGTIISLFVSKLTGCDGYALWQELGLPSFIVLDVQSKAILNKINLE
jgi:broad specificity phosphatase PhoE